MTDDTPSCCSAAWLQPEAELVCSCVWPTAAISSAPTCPAAGSGTFILCVGHSSQRLVVALSRSQTPTQVRSSPPLAAAFVTGAQPVDLTALQAASLLRAIMQQALQSWITPEGGWCAGKVLDVSKTLSEALQSHRRVLLSMQWL